jgi:D-allose transport system substrate-binding protein
VYNRLLHFQWPAREAEAQLYDLLDLLNRDFDALIINPLSRTNLIPGILAAIQKEIPILDVGGKTDPDFASDASSFYIPISTVDFWEQGTLGAKYLLDCLLPQGGKVAIMEGRKDATQSIGRSDSAEKVLQAAKDIELIFRGPADFDRIRAAEVACDLLQQSPDIRGFFCANDLMSLGVADAVKSLHCSHEVFIVGVDLIPEARQAILNNQIHASVAFSRADVARMVLLYASCAITGTPLPSGRGVRNQLVTSDNLSLY